MKLILSEQRVAGNAILDKQIFPEGIQRRALILINNRWKVIPDASLGTGLKPIVLYNSNSKVRSGNEGIPLVLINNDVVPLPVGDTLLI
jgi:hypothetical protein